MLARLAILAVAATLAASACTGATTSPSAPTTSEAPATEAPGSAAPASGSPAAAPAAPVNPYVETGAVPGSGAGKKIGYISLGEQVPFVVLVSNGIKEQAEIAGLELVFCDSKLDTPTALACAQQFAVQEVQGVLNFNVDEKASPQICEAYGNVPTIAIDIIQPPCQVAFMGADNHEAGRLGGAAIGKFAKETWDCDYTAYVSLESTGAKAASDARMGGYRDGFQEYCPIINEKIQPDVDRTDKAIGTMSDVLHGAAGRPHRRGRHQRGRHRRHHRRRRHPRPFGRRLLQRPGRRRVRLDARPHMFSRYTTNTSSSPSSLSSRMIRGTMWLCAPDRIDRPITSTSSCRAAVTI